MLLSRNNVLSLRTLLSGRNRKLNFLTFGEGFKAVTLNRAEVNKDIWAAFLLDEPKTLAFIEPFYGSCNLCHFSITCVAELLHPRCGQFWRLMISRPFDREHFS